MTYQWKRANLKLASSWIHHVIRHWFVKKINWYTKVDKVLLKRGWGDVLSNRDTAKSCGAICIAVVNPSKQWWRHFQEKTRKYPFSHSPYFYCSLIIADISSLSEGTFFILMSFAAVRVPSITGVWWAEWSTLRLD